VRQREPTEALMHVPFIGSHINGCLNQRHKLHRKRFSDPTLMLAFDLSAHQYRSSLPFDKVKIDRCFMQAFDGSGRDAKTVVKTIIALAVS
jgi:hypothetical protein